MLMTALYTFANKHAKTDEYDFRGFPALWNVAVFLHDCFESDPQLNLSVMSFLGVMTFAPLRFVHPLRVAALRRVTVPLLVVWAVMVFGYLGMGREVLPSELNILFWLLSFYFLILSAWRSWALRRGG